MPYRDLPPRVRVALRIELALVYLFGTVGGVGATVWTPPGVVDEIGWLIWVWSALTVGGSLACLVAVLRDDYRREMVFVWCLAGGVAMYAATSWLLVGTSVVRVAMSALLSMLAVFCVFRGTELVGHHRKILRFVPGGSS